MRPLSEFKSIVVFTPVELHFELFLLLLLRLALAVIIRQLKQIQVLFWFSKIVFFSWLKISFIWWAAPIVSEYALGIESNSTIRFPRLKIAGVLISLLTFASAINQAIRNTALELNLHSLWEGWVAMTSCLKRQLQLTRWRKHKYWIFSSSSFSPLEKCQEESWWWEKMEGRQMTWNDLRKRSIRRVDGSH